MCMYVYMYLTVVFCSVFFLRLPFGNDLLIVQGFYIFILFIIDTSGGREISMIDHLIYDACG